VEFQQSWKSRWVHLPNVFVVIYFWVNRQLPLKLLVLSIMPLTLTKLQLSPWNCIMLVNLPLPSISSVRIFFQILRYVQIPPCNFALMCKMPPEIYNNQANWSLWQKIFFCSQFFLSLLSSSSKALVLKPYSKSQANNIWLSSFQLKLVLQEYHQENANLETVKKTIFSFK